MKLLVFSDLHLEHRPDWELPADLPDFEVLVAAGDIAGSPAASIDWIAQHPVLQRKPAIFVHGNHELYRGTLEERIEEGFAAAARTGVHFLHGGTAVVAGTRFVGAPLWTDFAVHGDRDYAMAAAAESMNDYREIRRRAYGAGHKGRFRLKPKDTAWHHARQRAFIADALDKPFAGPTVVVTHHAPSPRSLQTGERADRHLDPAYASDLEGMIAERGPELWIHGHIHASVDYKVGGTRIVSNPKGYGPGLKHLKPENPAFDPRLVVEVGRSAATGSGEQMNAA